ncbi:MAG: L-threonylcarbamoyladenylate synthase [Candidatus Adlerbacteria bacterium]|nr:L-threonylcarbamoyladenylate synthase [Candidatus Adlerbacteria bacterium]
MEAVTKAVEVLRSGGVILYPTDTVYALAGDALRKEVLEKIYKIKGRDEGKPIHSVFSSLESASEYVEITPLARALAEKFLPGPLTLLLTKKDTVPTWVTAGKDTFGVRIPKNDFCLALAHEFKKPYTTTSANRAGEPTLLSPEEILAQLGKRGEEIDLVIDAGVLPASAASTIVDARGEKPVIVREGVISKEKIFIASER